MKTIKISTPDIKQTTLEAYRAKSSADTTYQIKEKTHGRGLGVFVIKVLPSREIDFYFHYFVEGKAKSKKLGRFGNAQGQLTLAKAKAEFRKMSTIYSSGIDPKVQAQESAQNLVKEKQRQDAIEQKLKMQGSLGQLSEYYLVPERKSHFSKNLAQN